MSKVRAENYASAQALIAAGVWRVDATVGVVYGSRGKPFRRTNSAGYVQIKYRDPADLSTVRAALAHRVIWESVHGPLPEHLTVNHLNGIKADNRIANLEAVTYSGNNRHAYATGLNPRRSCEAASNVKLTSEQAREIYRRAWAGESHPVIAADFGVDRSVVSNIKCGSSWREATGHCRRAA